MNMNMNIQAKTDFEHTNMLEGMLTLMFDSQKPAGVYVPLKDDGDIDEPYGRFFNKYFLLFFLALHLPTLFLMWENNTSRTMKV